MDKIKVLIIAGTMEVGGVENQLMHLLRNAPRERFRIDFTSTVPDAYYRAEIEALGGQYLQIPPMEHHNPFPYCDALYRIMKNGKYDVVHSHELFHSGIVLLIARLAGVPGRFVHAHNWQDHDGVREKRGVVRTIYNALMRLMINSCANGRLACSTPAGKFLYGEKTVRSSNYRLVYNSVDTTKFLDRYDRTESGAFCDEWHNVLHVGRVTRVKNQLFLTELAAEFKRRGEKIRILCAGNGDKDYIEEVNAAIASADLSDYMVLLGVRDDIDVLMRKSDAFVLPSKYEGMPLVLIEAQASGLSCVAADTFSHEVDFGLGRMEWLPLSDNIGIWADAVERAIAAERPEKKDVERVIQEKRFDSRCFAQILCRLYEETVRNVP